MLKIENLHARVAGKDILKGLSLIVTGTKPIYFNDTPGFTQIAQGSVIGALVAGMVVVGAGRLGADSGTGLVLAGAAVTAGCTAVTSSLVIALPGVLDRFRFWGLGSVARSGAPEIGAAVPFLLLGLVLVLAGAAALDIEDVAIGLAHPAGAGRGTGTASCPSSRSPRTRSRSRRRAVRSARASPRAPRRGRGCGAAARYAGRRGR